MTQDTTQPGKNDEENIIEEMEAIVEELSSNDPVTSPDTELVRLRDTLARSQADYQNLLMRVERDKADMAFYLSSKILTPLLTQVDTLERAVAMKADIEGDAFVDGVRALQGNMMRYLESQ